MEQLFEDHLMVQSAVHVQGRFGDDPASQQIKVSDVTENFHVYGMIWDPEKIVFTVDGEGFFTYQPEDRSVDFWPFDKDQYLLLNLAVGGTLGGEVDPNFTEDQMEVDYVRVYQLKLFVYSPPKQKILQLEGFFYVYYNANQQPK